ncbi:FAD-binding protein [Gorillibacterium sp. CAU 1737]|uniref:UDP-N-acetylmuramate dehydrogenase n=1 Tax=Gorillibacterium sp. CAU 1737 TaxID=3140362 RepID=UPI003260E0D8
MFKQELLARHCSYQIGGTAHYFSAPPSQDELIAVLQACKSHGQAYTIFGMGSNLLFPDRPREDHVYISLKRLAYWENRAASWFVSAGVPMSMLALVGLHSRIPDFERTYLLPGSLGAGIYMNAKFEQFQISDVIKRVCFLDLDQDQLIPQWIEVCDCQYGYKKSIFQEHNWLILGAELTVTPAGEKEHDLQMALNRWLDLPDSANLKTFYDFFSQEVKGLEDKGTPIPDTLNRIEQYRNGKYHFSYPSCGSVFKNNYDYGTPIGALVEQLNLKGLTHGGAMISPHHGNIIVNSNQASAQDIASLLTVIIDEIHRNFGFVPEPEVVILN